jgi:2-polyprenyl-6-methoxyphenol hydroxylase-like FAD-dependent oxidoreductase
MTKHADALSRDVIVVGAGLAGSAIAAVLARRGLAVTVVDPYPEFPALFRAEKIEPDQAALLQSLGLFDGVQQCTRTINEIIHARAGRILHKRQVEQFGISYCDTVNLVRAQIPREVEFLVGKVDALEADAKCPQVVLADGRRIAARLVVVATGMNGKLHEQLGIEKRMVQDELSMAFGFMLERADGQPFSFDAVTYRSDLISSRVGYLTLFRMGRLMRANIFAYWPARDSITRELIKDPLPVLARLLPGLDKVIGDYAVQGKIEPFRIDLYRMHDCARPGIVLVGDAYQSVCPSTGMGLSKVLTDVDVLCGNFLPQWLSAGAVPSNAVATFYDHPRKREVDNRAIKYALDSRNVVLSPAFQWRLRRKVRAVRFANGW